MVPKESLSVPIMEKRIRLDSIIHADEAYGWDPLHLFYEVTWPPLRLLVFIVCRNEFTCFDGGQSENRDEQDDR